MFPSNVKYYNTFTRYLNIFNLFFSFQAYNFFHTPLLRSTSFSSAWSRTDIIVTYLVPSFPRQIAIDRDPARVGTLRLKLRYPFDPPRDRSSCRSRSSISFLLLVVTRPVSASWWIVPHFPTGNPVGSRFRDEPRSMTVMIDLEIDPDHSIIHGYRLVSDRKNDQKWKLCWRD